MDSYCQVKDFEEINGGAGLQKQDSEFTIDDEVGVLDYNDVNNSKIIDRKDGITSLDNNVINNRDSIEVVASSQPIKYMSKRLSDQIDKQSMPATHTNN